MEDKVIMDYVGFERQNYDMKPFFLFKHQDRQRHSILNNAVQMELNKRAWMLWSLDPRKVIVGNKALLNSM